MLFPRESESREIRDLSGLWRFRADPGGVGERERWHEAPLAGAIEMPVPASYNDLTQERALREHVGEVWYETRFRLPRGWRDRRVVLRVGAASHRARVWVNGRAVAEHAGGFLPFEAEVNGALADDGEQRVTIAVDNRLDWSTLPPGEVREAADGSGRLVQDYFHDFFNYAGLHRPVRLYTTPRPWIAALRVATDLRGGAGIVGWETELGGGDAPLSLRLLDARGREAAAGEGRSGELRVPGVTPWAPGRPYLYTLEARTGGADPDVYRLPVGVRTVEVSGGEFRINGRPFYFRGFGKHEDADVRGKGLDLAIAVKDFHLLAWIGANSFRTSHYPYAEEILDLADRLGVAVIDEAPAVGQNFLGRRRGEVFCDERVGQGALKHHLRVMEELIERDRNHPCVVMWSVANEPASAEEGARPYFERVVARTRELDPSRPVTIVEASSPETTRVGDLVDVIAANRYFGWYSQAGDLDAGEAALERDLRAWHERFAKPVLLSEFGADTVAGLHHDPPLMFSEEFQVALLERYARVLDRLDFAIGEHVWNFADFMTREGILRVVGNRKGVFTRDRQPKAAAHWLRARWRAAED